MSSSYSQYGEDRIVESIFGDQIGTLLDIGAWSVKDLSNSRAFIERGWRATLVEFSPMPMHGLLIEYGYQDTVRLIQAAITAGPQRVTEFDITQNALSTADPAHKKRWADASCGYYGKLWVPTLTVEQLLAQFFENASIDYASIDTEGTSVEVAVALLSTEQRPKVVIVEYDDKLESLLQQAQQWGYKAVHTNETNVILAR